MAKILIVDDQKIPRHFFEMTIRSDPEYEIVKSLDSASVADIYCTKYPVDLIIMDVIMADGSNGLDAAERIRKKFPKIRILIVTSMLEAVWLERARKIGVDSFWFKEAGDEELLDVVRRTMKGEHIFPHALPVVSIGQSNNYEFTPAELLVLKGITTGDSNKVIAQKLGIEASTVKTHISSMLAKTGFDNRTELAIEARLRGLA